MQGDYQSAQFLLDILSFLFDRWEFLLGLLFGGGTTSYINYRIITKKKNDSDISQKGEDNQAISVIDSPNASPQVADRDAMRCDGQNSGVFFQNSPNSTVNVTSPTIGNSADALGPASISENTTISSLNFNQAHILQKVQEVIQGANLTSSFPERYQNAITHLNNNSAQVCASEYHSAFMDLVSVFVSGGIYISQKPDATQLTSFEISFTQIKTFLNDSSHDLNALRIHINNFEDSLIILLGYL